MTALTTPNIPTPWPPTLALELALKTAPIPVLLEAYELTQAQLVAILKNEAFKVELAAAQEKARTEGYSFKVKCGAIAEGLLPKVAQLIEDDDVPASARQKFMDSLVRWAGYEPKDGREAGQNVGGGVSVTINLGEATPRVVVGERVIE